MDEILVSHADSESDETEDQEVGHNITTVLLYVA